MENEEPRGLRENIVVMLHSSLQNVPTAVRSAWMGSATAANIRRLQRFLHNPNLANENCEDLVCISLAVFPKERNSVAYPTLFKTNGEVTDSLEDNFVARF